MLVHLVWCFAISVRTLMVEVWLLFSLFWEKKKILHVPFRKKREKKDGKFWTQFIFVSLKRSKVQEILLQNPSFHNVSAETLDLRILKRTLKRLKYQFCTAVCVFAEYSTKTLTLYKSNGGGRGRVCVDKTFIDMVLFSAQKWYSFCLEQIERQRRCNTSSIRVLMIYFNARR